MFLLLCTDGTLYEECAHILSFVDHVIVFVLFVFNVLEP